MKITTKIIMGVVLAVSLVACGGSNNQETSSSQIDSSASSSSESSEIHVSSSVAQSSSQATQDDIVIQENETGFCRALGAVETEHSGFTGDGFVNSSNEEGAYIEWQVEASESHFSQVEIRFANGGDRSRAANLKVIEPGEEPFRFEFATGSWTDWQTIVLYPTFYEGINTLRLTSDSIDGLPNIDSITLPGQYLMAVDCVSEQQDSEWTTTVPFSVSGQDGIHDPSTILKDGDRYWTFGTGIGAGKPVNALYSFDLMTWQSGPSPIPANTYPAWINTKLPVFDGNFWAPDIIEMNGRFYLYYSAFSSTVLNSAIGVMVSDSLNNPNWQDLGMVVSTQDEPRSSRGEPVNAIDAGLYRDKDGRVWMIYGSHYAGIFIREINPATGKLMNDTRYNAAGNYGGWNEYEAAQVQYIDGYYYLFINLGDCCQQLDSDYIMYVARSESPTGPFLTRDGHNLWHGDVISQNQVDSGVTTGSVLSSQPGRVGPGHFGYINNKGQHLVSIHYYGGNDGWGHLDILEMTFENGWPVLNYDFELRQ